MGASLLRHSVERTVIVSKKSSLVDLLRKICNENFNGLARIMFSPDGTNTIEINATVISGFIVSLSLLFAAHTLKGMHALNAICSNKVLYVDGVSWVDLRPLSEIELIEELLNREDELLLYPVSVEDIVALSS